MELKIVNDNTYNVAEAFGVNSERFRELMKWMDDYTKGNVRMVYIHRIFAEVAEQCNTPEELVLCVHMHTRWLLEKGRILDMVNQPDKWQ